MGEDGSLVFDTELDQTGFTKGSQKLLDAINDLISAVEVLGDNMMRSFGQVIPLLQSVATAATAVNTKMSSSAAEVTDANAEVVTSEEKVAEAAQAATNAVNQQNQSVQDYADAAKTAQAGAETMSQTSGSYDKAMQRIQKQIDAMKLKLADYYKAVADIQKSTDEDLALTDTREQAEKVMEMEEIQLQNLNEKYKAKLDTLKNLEAEYARLASLQAQANASNDPAAWDSKGITAQIDKATQAVDKYEEKVARMQYLGATDSQWQAVYYDIWMAIYKLDEYKETLASLNASGQINDEEYQKLSAALDEARTKATGLAAATQETRKFSDTLKTAAASALRLVGNLAKVSVNGIRAGFKKISHSVGEFINKAKNAKLSANGLVKALTSLKTMLISRIKRMFVSNLFGDVKSSLSDLEQYSSSFKAAMTSIKTAAAGVKSNLAATIGGLVEAVAPYITKFLNMLSKMISYVNAAFSLFRGKSSVTTASSAAQSYSDNMSSAASNTKKAAEAQKELNRQVYSFDELNKRSKEDEEDDNDDDNQTQSPFTDSSIGDILPEDLESWLKELKDLWDNGDYFDFGSKLAEKLNEMMQIADDWINNVFRPEGVKWAKNIAEVLNGLVDGFDATLFGKLIADSLNAVFDILNTFLTTFDFENLGKKIGETITSLFTNVEWDLIGKTFANGVNAIVDTLHGLVNAIEWDTVGDSIAEFFNNFMLGIDWNKLVKTVSDGVKGLETAILSFINGVKWRDIADSLAESLDHLDVAGILSKAGQIVGDLLKHILEFAAEFIKKVDWSNLMSGMWDGIMGMLQNIDWGGLISAAFELLGAAIGGAANLAATLIAKILELLVSGFEDAWSYFGDYINQCGGNIVEGIFLGIINALANIGQWIIDHIFKPFWDGLCHAFGIASPSTKMMEIGSYIIEGLLAGIKAAWGAITEFFSSALSSIQTAISTAWNTITTITTTVWDTVKNTVVNAWTGITTTVTNVTTSISNTMSTAWTTIKTTASTAWEAVKTNISTKFDAVKTNVKTTTDNVKKTVTDSWNTIKTDASTKWKAVTDEVKRQYDLLKKPVETTTNTVKKTIIDSWDKIKSDAYQKWYNIKNEVTRPMDEISYKMQYAWNQIKNDASRTWESIRSTVMDKWNSLKSSINSSAQYDWSNIGSRLVEGLRNGIARAWSSLTSWVSGLMSGLTGLVNRIFGIRSPSRVWAEIGEYLDLGLAQGIESTEGKVLSTVANLAENVGDEMQISDASVDMETGVKGAADSLSRVADMLSGIAETFQSITSMLNDIGGLHVPGLVSGSVVPSRTAVSGLDGSILDGSRFDSFESGLDERLYDQKELLERILTAITSKRGLDAEELADAIAFSMGNAIRGYGGV